MSLGQKLGFSLSIRPKKKFHVSGYKWKEKWSDFESEITVVKRRTSALQPNYQIRPCKRARRPYLAEYGILCFEWN